MTGLVIGIVVLAAIALALIIIAPWKPVRRERALPEAVQARLLLGESFDEVAAETEAGDADAAPPRRLRPPATH